jgi:hypothetical protein
MPRVLFVGQQPESVDFTNPVLPPGMNAEKIHAGIAVALKQMAERGWLADLCLLRPDETAGPDVERMLKAQAYASGSSGGTVWRDGEVTVDRLSCRPGRGLARAWEESFPGAAGEIPTGLLRRSRGLVEGNQVGCE